MDNGLLKETGVNIQTSVFPMAFLLLLFKTNITIDETTTTARWGKSFHALTPGNHRVTISFRYFLGRDMGKSSVNFAVDERKIVYVSYRSPLIVTGQGRITVVSDSNI